MFDCKNLTTTTMAMSGVSCNVFEQMFRGPGWRSSATRDPAGVGVGRGAEAEGGECRALRRRPRHLAVPRLLLSTFSARLLSSRGATTGIRSRSYGTQKVTQLPEVRSRGVTQSLCARGGALQRGLSGGHIRRGCHERRRRRGCGPCNLQRGRLCVLGELAAARRRSRRRTRVAVISDLMMDLMITSVCFFLSPCIRRCNQRDIYNSYP